MPATHWGRRLPNFVTDDASGARFEYHRDITRGPTVFLRDGSDPACAALAARVAGRATLCVFGSGDAGGGPSARRLADPDGRIRAALFPAGAVGPAVILADPAQRLVGRFAADPAGLAAIDEALGDLDRPPPQERRCTAPVMLLGNLLDAGLCRRLIEAFEAGNREGTVAIQTADGSMRQVELPDRKRRRDLTLDRADPLYGEVSAALAERLMPELWKAWWIERLRTEAFYVACYRAERADFFAAHRDNTLPGTARRRIAVSIELDDAYEGGGLVFPEYSDDRWRAAAGGGLVFSCSLMHEAVPVTAGRRYVLLAFLAAPSG